MTEKFHDTDRVAPVDADLPRVREAIAVIGDVETLHRAIDDLTLSGVERQDISLLASDETVENRIHSTYRSIDEAKHDPNAPRTSYVAPEEVGNAEGAAAAIPAYIGAVVAAGAIVATGGGAAIAAAGAAAAGLGAGGLGALVSRWVSGQRAEWLDEHLRKGGILVWVNLRDPGHERMVTEILSRYSVRPVETHELAQPDPIPGGRTI
ncbi:hypothetical protein [Arenibaculum sp.]|jgi:hypothetical protein|uniref:hypothetical protein n=1 Tax=Arenibaculum sp. TaxID=2865862 RepID=UPI002E113A67|nr:hypothetical protein [Arenibaculum sp.]